jgi:hypothetical protein
MYHKCLAYVLWDHGYDKKFNNFGAQSHTVLEWQNNSNYIYSKEMRLPKCSAFLPKSKKI